MVAKIIDLTQRLNSQKPAKEQRQENGDVVYLDDAIPQIIQKEASKLIKIFVEDGAENNTAYWSRLEKFAKRVEAHAESVKKLPEKTKDHIMVLLTVHQLESYKR